MTTYPHEGDVCGYVLWFQAGRGSMAFYYCVAHKDYACSDVEPQIVFYEDIDPFIVCFLCHRALRSVAYIEKKIAEGDYT